MEVIGGEGADKLGLNDHGPISIYLCSKTEVDQCFSVISIGKEPRELFPLSTDYSIYCNSNRDKTNSTNTSVQINSGSGHGSGDGQVSGNGHGSGSGDGQVQHLRN